MKLVLASKSLPKIEGLKMALAKLAINDEFETYAARSGVPEQPEEDEVLLGARNRASLARTIYPDAYVIAVENGLRKRGAETIDIAVIAVITPDGTEVITESAPVIFPTHIVEEARRRGFDKVTAGKVLSERYGSTYGDPQSYLTGGKTNRAKMIAEAIKEALTEALS